MGSWDGTNAPADLACGRADNAGAGESSGETDGETASPAVPGKQESLRWVVNLGPRTSVHQRAFLIVIRSGGHQQGCSPSLGWAGPNLEPIRRMGLVQLVGSSPLLLGSALGWKGIFSKFT